MTIICSVLQSTSADEKNEKSFLELPSARGVFCSDAGTLFYNQLMIVRYRRVNLLNYCFATTEFFFLKRGADFLIWITKNGLFVLFEWLHVHLKRRELQIHYERGSPEDSNSRGYRNNTANKIQAMVRPSAVRACWAVRAGCGAIVIRTKEESYKGPGSISPFICSTLISSTRLHRDNYDTRTE